ncbi:Glycosyltransferase involved in cell wall bisynthesis [Thermomonospora echinospora]|uniref:Glycosyltransferase involved in cell wall bisynthesis n=1 Tax=Thermomonospora echinospora TaxID=1992 RepID=A0A1H5XQQ4_9ACTN|nr:glycosyltransferase family 4 protein [Thermomonospora echinospora]SEG13596.1 Glycosyltransferase involved in cell wall bisynthesis [Thermomonospora echinospora]
MRIAMVAPPWYEIPPPGYGGTEAVVAKLIDGLHARGHEVMLVAAGRNGTAAEFGQTYPEPQHPRFGQVEVEVAHAVAAAEYIEEFGPDVVHDHTLVGPLTAPARRAPTIVTAHLAPLGEAARCYRFIGRTAGLMSVSRAQQRVASGIRWAGVAHNAVDPALFPYRDVKDGYVVFLGRMCADKGVHVAITAARAAGYPIKMAGRCTRPEETEYFERRIRPLLGPDAEYLGELDTRSKYALLAGARCLLFPIQWEEPFGVVLIEAMACGTPVVALRRAAVPEVVEPGVTGLVCDTEAELPDAIRAVERIDPWECRRRVGERFDVATMTGAYENAYRRLARAYDTAGRRL